MDAFKAEHYERVHPGVKFPSVVPLARKDAATLAERMATLIARVHSSDPVPALEAQSEAFQLGEAWRVAAILPADEVLVSFDAMRSIDIMRRNDVEQYFADVWYPISDNMYLFDRTTSWLLFVHHDGFIYTARG